MIEQTSLLCSVLACSAWSPNQPNTLDWSQPQRLVAIDQNKTIAPAVLFVDAMNRRRLGRLARMFLHVAHALVTYAERQTGGPLQCRTVFASRHGDLQQTVHLLSDLAQRQPLSPTAFGLSVHNAIPGFWSMLRQDQSAVSAIAAGDKTFAAGLLEAVLQWRERPIEPVLFVYAEDAVPMPYASEIGPGYPVACGLLLADLPGAREIALDKILAEDSAESIKKLLNDWGVFGC